jgi:type VI secretion system Hcp family effector
MAETIKGTFLEIDGIKGNCVKKDYKDQIEIRDFSFGISNTASAIDLKKEGTQGGRGCSISDISISKLLDKSSTQLNVNCAVGTLFKKITITCVDKKPIYTVTLEPAVISSISTSGGDGGDVFESISFNAAKTTWQFQKESDDFWDSSDNTNSVK